MRLVPPERVASLIPDGVTRVGLVGAAVTDHPKLPHILRHVVEERGLPVDHLPGHGAGWQAHLEDLGRSLAGEPSSWRERWTQLTPVYAGLPVAQ